jgi:HlyD family secretion protein
MNNNPDKQEAPVNKSNLAIILPCVLLLGVLTACDRQETTYMVGTLERDRIDVVVESNEPITVIHAKDGQEVEPGDLILEQDPARAAARLAQQVGLRNQAAARLAELERGPREELIREARAKLEASRARQINAKANLQRTREVFERGLSSEGRLDLAETNHKTAVEQVNADSEALDRLLHGTTIEELDQAAAAVEAGEAQVRQAQLDLERTRILAPVAGVVDKVLFRVGERPAPGTTIAVILDSSRTYARVYVPEHLRTRVTPGAGIDVRIDGEEETFSGTVRWVSSDATFTPYFALTEHDRSRLSFLAEIDIPDAAQLPSGVPLQADFPVE